MLGGIQISTDAEQLLSGLRRSIAQTTSQCRSALYFVGDDPTVDAPAIPLENRLEAARAVIAEAVTSYGSLPPSPPTLRARLGLVGVGLINRVVWWQMNVSRRFAMAVNEYLRVQMEDQARQEQALITIEERLHTVEQAIQDLQRDEQR